MTKICNFKETRYVSPVEAGDKIFGTFIKSADCNYINGEGNYDYKDCVREVIYVS